MDEVLVRALADPLRMRIVGLLAAEQLCTCHLVEERARRRPTSPTICGCCATPG